MQRLLARATAELEVLSTVAWSCQRAQPRFCILILQLLNSCNS